MRIYFSWKKKCINETIINKSDILVTFIILLSRCVFVFDILIQSMLLSYEFKFQLDKLNRIQIYTIWCNHKE